MGAFSTTGQISTDQSTTAASTKWDVATMGEPTITPEAQRENGGWYYNPATGNVDRWDASAAANSNTFSGDTSGYQSYLNNVQNGVASDTTLDSIWNKINEMLPTKDYEVPSFEDMYKELSTQYGLDTLNEEINSLTSQVNDQQAIKQQRQLTELNSRNPNVTMDVREGRVSEIETQENYRISELNRQKDYLVNQVTSATNTISTIMNYKNLDYQTAKSEYDSDYNKIIEVTKLAYDMYDSERSFALQLQDSARANLTIITNAITSGQMSYDSLDSATKSQIQQLEVQSGLPVGTVASLKLSAKDSLLSINSETGQALIADGSGGYSVKQVFSVEKSAAAVGSEAYYQNVKSEYESAFGSLFKQGDGTYVNGSQFQSLMSAWTQDTSDTTNKSFISLFGRYTNEELSDAEFKKQYGFNKSDYWGNDAATSGGATITTASGQVIKI